MVKEDSGSKKVVRAYAQAGAYIGMGLQFSISILLCLFLGRWADSKLETEPLFLLLGTFMGAGAGLYNLYKGLIANEKEKKEGNAD